MLEMFKIKKINSKLKKENVTIGMMLVVITRSQVFEVDAFRQRRQSETRLLQTNEKNNFLNHLKMSTNNYKRRNHH
jgi:hypothetical protein